MLNSEAVWITPAKWLAVESGIGRFVWAWPLRVQCDADAVDALDAFDAFDASQPGVRSGALLMCVFLSGRAR